MKRYALALILTVLFSCTCWAESEYTALSAREYIRLGDQQMRGWPVWKPSSTTFNRSFFVEGPTVSSRLDLYLFGSCEKSSVLVNGNMVGSLCDADDWMVCNISIPVNYLLPDANLLTIASGWGCGQHLETGYDDFMVKGLALNILYESLEPEIVSSKTQSTYECEVGDEVNVSVVLTNLGARPAYNVTITDPKPRNTYIVRGVTEDFTSHLSGGEMIRLKYSITPDKPAKIRSWSGRVTYLTGNGSLKSSQIISTTLDVKPPKPYVHVIKSIIPMSVSVGGEAIVRFDIVNNGSQDVVGLYLIDEIPDSFQASKGLPEFALRKLPAGENFSLGYVLSPKVQGDYLLSSKLRYEDLEGNEYVTYSNHVRLKATQNPATGIKNDQVKLFAVAVALLIFLIVLYFYIRGR